MLSVLEYWKFIRAKEVTDASVYEVFQLFTLPWSETYGLGAVV